jgi:hypothetical protein
MTPSICKLSAKLSPLPRNSVATQPRPTSPRDFQALARRAIAARVGSFVWLRQWLAGPEAMVMQWPQWSGLRDMSVPCSSQSRAPDTLGFQQSMWSPQQLGHRQQNTRSRSGLIIAATVAVKGPHSSRCVRSVGSSAASGCVVGYQPCRVPTRQARHEATAADAQKLARLQELRASTATLRQMAGRSAWRLELRFGLRPRLLLQNQKARTHFEGHSDRSRGG